MKTLIRYEFLKILRRRSASIILTVSLLLTAFLFGLPVLQYQHYTRDGVVRGLEGIALEKAQYAEASGFLTDEYVAETVREYQRLFADPANVGYDGNEKFLVGDAYWDFVAPRERLLRVIAATYDAPGENSGFDKLPELDLSSGFRQARERKIQLLLDAPSRNLSDAQKAYWSGMNDKVETPLPYGCTRGWEMVIDSFELLTFGILAVCIVLAPVFSGEYQSGMDAVILSARYGRTKLIWAKIGASLLFGTLAFALHAAAALIPPLAAFGLDGWNLPMQIVNTVIPYPWSFLQAAVAGLGVVYLVQLGMIALTLLLSANMRSPYLASAVLVPVLFLPIFLMPDGTTGVYNLTLFLLPYRAVMPELGKYISYQLGGVVLDALSMRAIFYASLAASLLPLAGRGFRRRQVST